jgi:hypothetical protein
MDLLISQRLGFLFWKRHGAGIFFFSIVSSFDESDKERWNDGHIHDIRTMSLDTIEFQNSP